MAIRITSLHETEAEKRGALALMESMSKAGIKFSVDYSVKPNANALTTKKRSTATWTPFNSPPSMLILKKFKLGQTFNTKDVGEILEAGKIKKTNVSYAIMMLHGSGYIEKLGKATYKKIKEAGNGKN